MESLTLVGVIYILILFIPGYLFKRFYFSGKFTKQFTFGDFAERLTTSLFWGVVIQLITFNLFQTFIKINIKEASSAVSNTMQKLAEYDLRLDNQTNLQYGLIYIASSIFMGILLGYTLHKVVRFLKIDIMVKALRFSNEWHYIFGGNNIKASQRIMGKGKIEAVSLDILSDGGDGKTVIYRGILNEYTQTPTGELDTVSITGAERFNNDEGSFLPIPGDCFVIPYSKVININVRYIIRQRVPFTFTGEFAIVRNIAMVLFLVSLIIVPFIVPLYYFHKIGLGNTVLAIVLGWLAILALATFCSLLVAPAASFLSRQNANKKSALWYRIAALVVNIVLFLAAGIPLYQLLK